MPKVTHKTKLYTGPDCLTMDSGPAAMDSPKTSQTQLEQGSSDAWSSYGFTTCGFHYPQVSVSMGGGVGCLGKDPPQINSPCIKKNPHKPIKAKH